MAAHHAIVAIDPAKAEVCGLPGWLEVLAFQQEQEKNRR